MSLITAREIIRPLLLRLVERKEQEQLAEEAIPDILFRLVDFMQGREEWTGTATELLDALGETGTAGVTPCKRSRKNQKIFLTAGVALRAEKGE